MLSVQDAVAENLIEPIFIGDKKEILKCAEDLKWDISNFEIIDEPVENNTAKIAAQLASKGKSKNNCQRTYSYRCLDERSFKKRIQFTW
jgi:phosphate acetyltransferase